MTAGQEEGGDGGGSEGGDGSKPLLTQVDLLVPLSPDLGRGEHASRAAHVTKCGLTSTVSSTSRDTRDTGNSATSTPTLSTRLMTGLLAHGIGLASVLRDTGVHRLHDIRTDRGIENLRQRMCIPAGRAIGLEDSDSGTRCHRC